MSTPYTAIYENMLPKFRSYEIPLMTIEEVQEYLHDFIAPAIARFHICRKDLNNRDETLEQFNVDLSLTEIEIISNFALIEYVDSTYVRTATLLKVNLSSSDFNSYSPANMLDKLLAMHDAYRRENETLLSRYSWLDNSFTTSKLSPNYKK